MSGRAGSYTLGEYPTDMVRLVCDRCARRGRYLKTTLIDQYDAYIALPDLLVQLAKCERHHPTDGGCGAHYQDLTG